MTHTLVLQAPAKINLSLEVLGRRADGFHDLVSIMQTVTLCDTLHFSDSPDVVMSCSDPHLQTEDNLVLKAARLVRRHFGVSQGCFIELEKRIPAAAGLGGGSSDAAATLLALAEMWQLPATRDELHALAEELGSDVPFFLYGGTCLVEGRGEQVTPLPDAPVAWYLLIKAPPGVSTAGVFRRLPSQAWSDGTITRGLADRMRTGRVALIGINGLQETVFQLYPEAWWSFEKMETLAPGRTILTGSGPTVVGIFGTYEEADAARDCLETEGSWVVITRAGHATSWGAVHT